MNVNQEQAGTMSSALVGQVRASIMRGDLPPGSKLHLGKLQAVFGCSLSPLREALCRLESEGLVRIADHRGYRVAPVSGAELTELIRLRVALETMALQDAMQHGDLDWEAGVLAALHRLNATPRTEPEAWETAHRGFHAQIIAACAMPLLRQFCATLHDKSDRYRRLFLTRHEPDRDVPAEHRAIAEAAIARKKNLAETLLRDHIERTGRKIEVALTKT